MMDRWTLTRMFPAMLSLAMISSLILAPTPARADLKGFAKRWTLRAVGVVAAVGVHEACHIGLAKAMGGNVRFGNDPDSIILPYIITSGLSTRQHRVIAASGLACTAIVSEIVIRTGAHKKNDIAWGFLADHIWNSAAYARYTGGDSLYWKSSGGSAGRWRAMWALHSTRSGYVLLRDEPWFQAGTRRIFGRK